LEAAGDGGTEGLGGKTHLDAVKRDLKGERVDL
jgi:hypothetical protein